MVRRLIHGAMAHPGVLVVAIKLLHGNWPAHGRQDTLVILSRPLGRDQRIRHPGIVDQFAAAPPHVVEALGLRYVELSSSRDSDVDGDGPLFAREDEMDEL